MFAGLITAIGLLALATGVGAAPPRVFSLDQCADQYVIALAPRASIVGVSPRVGAWDSYLRAQARGLPVRRATAESVLAAQAQLVVTNWGGDARLTQTLARRHIAVARIAGADDFDGVRANIRAVAAALGQTARGEALIARLDRQLAQAAGAWRGRGALYVAPGGYTAGRGTLIDAMLTGAGLRNEAPRPGFSPISLERLVMHPPSGVVLGFFDGPAAGTQWGPGHSPVLKAAVAGRTLASLPASVLGCPAWFAGDAVQILADKARAGRRP